MHGLTKGLVSDGIRTVEGRDDSVVPMGHIVCGGHVEVGNKGGELVVYQDKRCIYLGWSKSNNLDHEDKIGALT